MHWLSLSMRSASVWVASSIARMVKRSPPICRSSITFFANTLYSLKRFKEFGIRRLCRVCPNALSCNVRGNRISLLQKKDVLRTIFVIFPNEFVPVLSCHQNYVSSKARVLSLQKVKNASDLPQCVGILPNLVGVHLECEMSNRMFLLSQNV